MPSVLLVEDEPSLAESVRYNLEREGFTVTVEHDGARGLAAFRAAPHDLVILDLMLPGMPGLDVCRKIREDSTVPIIIVTAKDAEADKVAGLELGADDYVTKPFSVRELVSRVRANLRRTEMVAGNATTASTAEPVLIAGPVELDAERHRARVDGIEVELPPKEFALLRALLERVGKLATREALIDEVWGYDYVGDTKTLDVHVKRLRARIEPDPHAPVHLLTVRGLGYRFEP